MSQIVTALLPTPITSPTCFARPPVRTTATALTVSSTTVTRVTARRSGMVFQIGLPSPTSQTMFEARMNPAIYAEADHRPPARPTMNRMPAVPLPLCTFLIALVKISLAGPGATLLRFSINGCVAECPINPRIETSTISMGKIASTP
jgi:hypothetical protein